MVSPDTIRTAIGVIGNGTALVLFLSPVLENNKPTIIRVWKKGSVEQYSPVPYLATLLNCMMWVLYGLPAVHPHSMLVVTINGTGMAIELTYITLFLLYSTGATRRRVLLQLAAEVAFVGAIAMLVLNLSHTYERRSMVVGILCVLFGTGMYAAPLSVTHENGNPDEECGVHAVVPVASLPGERHLLDCIRAHPLRPLHHHPQRAGGAVRAGTAGPLRHLLQVHPGDHRGTQAQGRPGRHDRDRRRRQDQQRRPLLMIKMLSIPAGRHQLACSKMLCLSVFHSQSQQRRTTSLWDIVFLF